jgi:hypothetical protein
MRRGVRTSVAIVGVGQFTSVNTDLFAIPISSLEADLQTTDCYEDLDVDGSY